MIRVEHLSWKVDSKTILKDLDFKLDPFGLTIILGPNGAGKSTLIKLLCKDILPSEGSIFWKGAPLSKYNAEDLAASRAVLTQKVAMNYSFPVEEVVMMGRYPHFDSYPGKVDFEAVDYCLEAVQAEHLKNRDYQSLSGGEQQRIQLARVLAQLWEKNGCTEKTLLLDEPLNNLDIRHQHQILKLSRSFANKGNTAIAVLHDINLAAQYADQILLLKNGQLLAFGPPADVLEEEMLSYCYDMPVRVQKHPFENCPVVYFGKNTSDKETSDNLFEINTA